MRIAASGADRLAPADVRAVPEGRLVPEAVHVRQPDPPGAGLRHSLGDSRAGGEGHQGSHRVQLVVLKQRRTRAFTCVF